MAHDMVRENHNLFLRYYCMKLLSVCLFYFRWRTTKQNYKTRDNRISCHKILGDKGVFPQITINHTHTHNNNGLHKSFISLWHKNPEACSPGLVYQLCSTQGCWPCQLTALHPLVGLLLSWSKMVAPHSRQTEEEKWRRRGKGHLPAVLLGKFPEATS